MVARLNRLFLMAFIRATGNAAAVALCLSSKSSFISECHFVDLSGIFAWAEFRSTWSVPYYVFEEAQRTN